MNRFDLLELKKAVEIDYKRGFGADIYDYETEDNKHLRVCVGWGLLAPMQTVILRKINDTYEQIYCFGSECGRVEAVRAMELQGYRVE